MKTGFPSAPTNLWKYADAVFNLLIFLVCYILQKQIVSMSLLDEGENSLNSSNQRKRENKNAIRQTNLAVINVSCELVQQKEERPDGTASSGFPSNLAGLHTPSASVEIFWPLPCVVSKIQSPRLSHAHYLSSFLVPVENRGAWLMRQPGEQSQAGKEQPYVWMCA